MDLSEQAGSRNFNIRKLKLASLPRINALLDHTPIAPTNLPEQNARQGSLSSHVLTPAIPIPYFAEVIHPRDPRAGLFNESKRKDTDGLLSHGTACTVLCSEYETSLTIIPSRFVLTIKHDENGEELHEAK